MNIIDTAISDVKIIEPKFFGDERGFFYESFNKKLFDKAIGRSIDFVQDNHSRSISGVLRGLHYQIAPYEQGKLVRVCVGVVYDVVVDIRPGSATFGKWIGVHLSAENKKQLWVPPGFAHGFQCLSDSTEFLYKTTEYYMPEAERCLSWDDPDLNIDWPMKNSAILSEKDKNGMSLAELIAIYSEA